ncbi:MAG: hypothetical protein KKD05_11740 [Candidatus Omnitrophica bacterium]|nr:hypothetical protein [Candidatus Omnitrophota bacterium]
MSLILEKEKAQKEYLKNNYAFNELESIFRVFAKGGSFLFVGDNKKQIEMVIESLTKKETCVNAVNPGQDNIYCGQCRDCQLIAARQHPDVHWIAPKGTSGSIKIEDIRLLNEQINLKPFQAERKTFIIQDAQRMGPEAANALLKTLEEPPQNASLVLVAKSLAELLPTIVSRCKLVRFSQDGSNLSEDQQLLDQLIQRFFEQEDMPDGQSLYEDIGALDRSMVEHVLYELACVMRDILIVGLKTDGVKLISSQSAAKIKQWAGLFNQSFIERILEQIIWTKSNISKNANIKLAIDLLVKSINKYKFENN